MKAGGCGRKASVFWRRGVANRDSGHVWYFMLLVAMAGNNGQQLRSHRVYESGRNLRGMEMERRGHADGGKGPGDG
jgi:hypothetical protein